QITDPSGLGSVIVKQHLPTVLAPNMTYSFSTRASTAMGAYSVELWAGSSMLASASGFNSSGSIAMQQLEGTYTASTTDALLGVPLEIRLVTRASFGSGGTNAAGGGTSAGG